MVVDFELEPCNHPQSFIAHSRVIANERVHTNMVCQRCVPTQQCIILHWAAETQCIITETQCIILHWEAETQVPR